MSKDDSLDPLKYSLSDAKLAFGGITDNYDAVDARLNQPIMKDTTYNRNLKEEQLKKDVAEKVKRVNQLKGEATYVKNKDYVWLMNYVEKIMHACGAEPKANFVEVTRDFMKLITRVPLKANLHPVLPEDDASNPRFHKVVTQVLMELDMIGGVRWVPTESGVYLIISVKR